MDKAPGRNPGNSGSYPARSTKLRRNDGSLGDCLSLREGSIPLYLAKKEQNMQRTCAWCRTELVRQTRRKTMSELIGDMRRRPDMVASGRFKMIDTKEILWCPKCRMERLILGWCCNGSQGTWYPNVR